MQELLIKQGIPTYIINIFTDLGAVAESPIQIGKQMPTNIGLIYGISVNVDGVQPDNASNAMITQDEASKIWLTLVAGSLSFLKYVKLDQLVFSSSTLGDNQQRFLPVNIPNNFSLDLSQYFNPESIINKTISLQFWYIDKESYNRLVSNKLIVGSIIQAPKI